MSDEGRHVDVKIIGEDPTYGPAVVTVRGAEIRVRVDLASRLVRYKCSACGRLAEPCRHLSLAILARAIQFRGDQP